MSHTPYKQEFDRKHGPQPEYDDNVLRLLECINSGQVAAAQVMQHYAAGEIQTNQGASDGRNTED